MTIYALSSGPGVSGIAVIRVSGSDTKSVIKHLTKKNLPVAKMASLRKFTRINSSELIDEGILLWFPGPESYTGEDLAEFHIHGSIAVIKAIQDSISKVENCRLAEPGEFTKIAFQNGKLDLLKAESIADLISSQTEIQRQQAIKIMEGNSANKFNELRNELLKTLSHIEAKIDFPDEDLPKEILNNISASLEKTSDNIKKILDDKKIGEIIREGFKIAIVGPTNAGKSSLINYLSNRDVAIVSEIAGTTRDVIETHLNLDGYPVIISDTAGIRDSKNEIEKKGIKLAIKKAEEADLRIVLIEPKNLNFTGFLKDLFDENSILVINKCDISQVQLTQQLNQLNPIIVSIKNNTNLNQLILEIKNKIKKKFIISDNIFITRERHREHLERCLSYIKKFNKKSRDEDFDKAAEDLRLATKHLGMIVGKIDVEEILGAIFKDFCIGK